MNSKHSDSNLAPARGHDIPIDNKHIKEAFARCNDCVNVSRKHENSESEPISPQ